MAVGGPRTPILAPDLLAPTVSFVTTALEPDAAEKREVGIRWGTGASFRSIACSGDAVAYDVCALPAFDDGVRSTIANVDPFAIVVPDTCSTFGFTYADYQARTLQKHRARESYVIARQFWTGALIPNSFHLQAGGAVNDISPGGTALVANEALGYLEEALGDCMTGARGMIYCSQRVFLALFLAVGLYRPPNSRLVFTHMDNPVAVDAGFPGSGPNGEAATATQEWMFASAPAKIYRSDPVVYPTAADFASNPKAWQAVARDRNDVTFRAESLAAVAVDPCCLIAIKVAVGTAAEAEGGGVGQTITDHSGTIAAGGVAQTLMAANSARRYLLIENVSVGDLWFNFTTTAVVGQPSLKLPSGGSFVMEDSPISTESISIIGATLGQAFVAKEA